MVEFANKQAPHGDVKFAQRFFLIEPGLSLELRECPRLSLGETVQVKDWGIDISYSELRNLERHIARTFRMLYDKAKTETLSEHEKAQWMKIVSRIDYPKFCADSAPARYEEGVLVSQDPVRVSWCDDDKETLSDDCAQALNLVESDERFSAFVKRDAGGHASSVSRVSILGPGQPDWTLPEPADLPVVPSGA